MSYSREKGLSHIAIQGPTLTEMLTLSIFGLKREIETSITKAPKIGEQVFRHNCYWKRSRNAKYVPQVMETGQKHPGLAPVASNGIC